MLYVCDRSCQGHDYLVTYKVIGGVPSFVIVFCCHRGKQNGGSLVSRDGYFGSNEFLRCFGYTLIREINPLAFR